MELHIEPLTLLQANECVEKYHRHHGKLRGFKFAVGLFDEDGSLHGAAMVNRPASPSTEQYHIAEVARLVTDGTPNACSMLYAACAKAAKAMGYWSIQTFTLDSEPGTSLKASGWVLDHRTLKGGSFNEGIDRGTRQVNKQIKVMWKLDLNPKHKYSSEIFHGRDWSKERAKTRERNRQRPDPAGRAAAQSGPPAHGRSRRRTVAATRADYQRVTTTTVRESTT
jgi:hypothetical protein